MTLVLNQLPAVSAAEAARITAAPRTEEAHRALMASLPAMTAVEVSGTPSRDVLPKRFTAAAWNIERCLFPEKSADLLADLRPDVVLLSEVDAGMARTGQRHNTAEMAQALGMTYAYGVEFYEMGLGSGKELEFCSDDANALGFHGNAILSSAPFIDVTQIRLDERGHWFCTTTNPGADTQPRVGERMAIAATILSEEGPVCVVSTHLESNADAAHRHQQFARILDAVDHFAPGLPTLIGGDLNTGNHLPPDFDHRQETLFALAEARGFDWGLTPEGVTTRASLITPHDSRRMKLDWFCQRGFSAGQGRLIAALDPEDVPLSDHECISAELTL
ncbi:endonuclease [Cognatishimia sp. SS12]|uniref:endonuclease/exonuclease/phosphatase family protein n=1 Tax=Cognatishimia sp. SS12 TaxID=2979465 RepID=UPI0023305853|nr:endonuclease/exonuclease/phosphatase family protein [Cognatishimia sp. SS12]MDC0738430.1 endonuclease [Cognatishimia sp. SS12]